MKLGTIVYDNQIHNLDYMTADEIKILQNMVEADKMKSMNQAKKELETTEDEK